MLLTVVGHAEKELRIGTFDHAMALLRPVLSTAGGTGIESYFQLFGHPQQTAIDDALDRFSTFEKEEQDFWEEYRRRVNAALETELREEVVVRVPVRRKHAEAFAPYVQTFANWQATQLENSGTLAPLQLSSVAVPASHSANAFQLDGQVWTIRHDGQTIHLKDSKGLRYFAVLLSHPNRAFHVLELVRQVEGMSTDVKRSQTVLDRDELADLSQSQWGFGDAGDVIDEVTRASLKQYLERTAQEIEERQEFGDANGADRLRAEYEQVVSHLQASMGLGGQSRKSLSTVERARVNITKRIRHACSVISAHHPALGHHLRSVKTGTYCEYAPPHPTNWRL
jgi:hypothetical protein